MLVHVGPYTIKELITVWSWGLVKLDRNRSDSFQTKTMARGVDLSEPTAPSQRNWPWTWRWRTTRTTRKRWHDSYGERDKSHVRLKIRRAGALPPESVCFTSTMFVRPLRRAVRNRILESHFHSSSSLWATKKVLQRFKLADIGEGITECEVIKW